MGNARRVQSYSPFVRQLVETNCGVTQVDGQIKQQVLTPAEMTFEFTTMNEAKKARFLLYGYLNACDRSKEPFLVEQAKGFRTWYMLRVKGSKLILEPRGNDPISLVFAKGIAKQQLERSGIDTSKDHTLTTEEIDALFKGQQP